MGQRNFNCTGIRVKGNAAPELINCQARYKMYEQFLGGTGTESDVVDESDGSYLFNNRPSPKTTTAGFKSVLLNIEIRINEAVSVATIDIGTTQGGSEIVGGIDASSEQRINPSFTRPRFSEGHEINVTASDQNVVYNLRYTIAADASSWAIELDT